MNSILLPLSQAAAVPTSRTWFDNPAIQNKLGYALVETLAMTFVSGAITVILGLLLGLALVSTGKRGQFRNPTLYWVLSQIVNIGRSMPFIILMVALIPLTRLLVGTSLGWQAACVPLTIGAIPFYARLVETAINDVDRGKVEAALMMGASGRQITWGVLVREALPILIQSATVTIITLLGYSAMAGAVGGGGVGDLAIQYGYQRNQVDVMVITESGKLVQVNASDVRPTARNTMGVIFSAGVIGSFIYTRAMGIVTQGTLKHMRDDMFDSMERLPLRFFDTHPHGAIMSTFTNDTDAIRQLIGQSIPTLIQSGLTIIVLIGTMLYYSVWLFLVVLVVGVLMVFLTGKLGGLSGRFMKAQQAALADEEGFIEEMMDGQKVVQVFNHEQDAKDEFVEYNAKLFDSSQKANIYGNVLMPALGNIGNIMYVVVAIVGGVMILEQTPNIHLFGVDVITVGVVVSFLGMVRNFSQTIGQMSMQVPMIALGMAGGGGPAPFVLKSCVRIT